MRLLGSLLIVVLGALSTGCGPLVAAAVLGGVGAGIAGSGHHGGGGGGGTARSSPVPPSPPPPSPPPPAPPSPPPPVPDHLEFRRQPSDIVAGRTAPTAGLFRYWRLDEGSGIVAHDETGAADGTLVNGPTWTTGVKGGALDFDGVNDYVTAGSIPALAKTSSFSWSFWVNIRGFAWTVLGNRFGNPATPMQFAKFTSESFEYHYGAATDGVSYTIPRNRWVHLAMVKDGPGLTFTLYSDGVVVATNTATIDMSANPFYMGGDPGGEFAACKLDEVRLYDRALTSAEVALLADATSGSVIAPSVQVAIVDASGQVATGANGPITIALGSSAPGAALAGTAVVNAANGVASFGDLAIDKAGSGTTLVATTPGLTGATSAGFEVKPGAPSKVSFATQPTTVTAGVSISPAVRVSVEDVLGNPVGPTTVTIALGANPGSATLSGSTSQTTVNGIATFSDLALDKAASGTTLVAAVGALTKASDPFEVRAAATATLEFLVQPSDAIENVAIAPAIEVRLRDAFGNVATSVDPVTLAPGQNPSGAALAGVTSIVPVNGVARFTNVAVDRRGNPFSLVASLGAITKESAAFEVTGPPHSLSFVVQPSNTTASGPVVSNTGLYRYWPLDDGAGTTAHDVTGHANGTLVNGPTWTTGVKGGALAFDGTDDYVAAGTIPALSLSDAFTWSFWVYLLPTSNPGAVLIGNRSGGGGGSSQFVKFTPGEFQFYTGGTPYMSYAVPQSQWRHLCAVKNGSSLTYYVDGAVVVTDTARADMPWNPFYLGGDITWGPEMAHCKLDEVRLYTRALSAAEVGRLSTLSGDPISPAVEVVLLDSSGRVVKAATTPVTIAIGTNSGGGTLTGTTTVAPSQGKAVFADLAIDKAGTAYTLVASATGATGATSSTFDVTAESASRLSFVTQPSATAAGAPITPAVRVTLEDGLGNVVTAPASVTVALATNPAGGTLSGTLTVAAVNGVATFSDLSIGKAASGYKLVASSGAFTRTSDSFDVTPGAAHHLTIEVQPTTTAPGFSMVPPVRVAVVDALGNHVNTPHQVNLALGALPANGAVLSGGGPVTTMAGVATFPALQVDRNGTGYTLEATASGLAGVTTRAFDVGLDVQFEAPWNVGTSEDPGAIAMGDLNGDGILDVVIAYTWVHKLMIRLGLGAGRFGPETLITLFPNGTYTNDVEIRDVNGDGKKDLIVLNSGANNFCVLIGAGDGTFAAPVYYGIGTNPQTGLGLGDFNGDGILDVVAGTAWGTGITLRLGDGTGAFPTRRDFSAGTEPHGCDAADIDGDGKLDVAVCGRLSNTVTIFKGDGTGNLSAVRTIAVASAPRHLRLADLNHDGLPDLVVAHDSHVLGFALNKGGFDFYPFVNLGVATGDGFAGFVATADLDGDGHRDLVSGMADTLNVFFGDGAGGFVRKVFPVGWGAGPCSIVDVDGDGRLDIVLSHTGNLGVSGPTKETFEILLNRGGRTFNVAPTVTTGGDPGSVAIGDLNGDGRPDLVTAIPGSNAVGVSLGTGGGAYGATTTYAAGTTPRKVVLADLNGDGKLDAVVTSEGSKSVTVLLGDGTGSLAAASGSTVGADAPFGLALADVNGDGKLDAVVSIPSQGKLGVLLGDGLGAFGTPAFFTTGGQPRHVTLADVTGDGKLDAIVPDASGSRVLVLPGDGAGAFGAATPYATGSAPEDAVVGDLNGDGRPDVVVANKGSGTISVLLGTGGGTFGAASTAQVGPNPVAIALQDLDGDGALDVLVVNEASRDVSILKGLGTGAFLGERRFAVDKTPSAIALGDLNGDGRADLAVANRGTGTVSLLLRR